MTALLARRMTILASKIMLTPAQAAALPAVVSKAAGEMGTTDAVMVERLLSNSAAAMYIAGVCRQVA